MGEHVGVDSFRVSELTIQRKGGTFAAFLRVVDEILPRLRAFFDSTNHNYRRFNYLGEWHSHHSFALSPSAQDQAAMNEIAGDLQFGAHFVVLMLVKLGDKDHLEGHVTVYRPDRTSFSGEVLYEGPLAVVEE